MWRHQHDTRRMPAPPTRPRAGEVPLPRGERVAHLRRRWLQGVTLRAAIVAAVCLATVMLPTAAQAAPPPWWPDWMWWPAESPAYAPITRSPRVIAGGAS